MQTITTSRLALAMTSGRCFALVNVLPEEEHDRGHIPLSINIPLESENFTARVAERLPHKATPVVVYSAGADCRASTRAATQLTEAGFSIVYVYPGGMDAWRRSSHPVSSAMPSRGS